MLKAPITGWIVALIGAVWALWPADHGLRRWVSVSIEEPTPLFKQLQAGEVDLTKKEHLDWSKLNVHASVYSIPDVTATTDSRSDGDLNVKDPCVFHRILVATITKGTRWLPGDRLVWTRLFVQPINFSFAGYTVAETENRTVKIATLETSSTKRLSSANGAVSDETTTKTDSDVNAEYEKLGIDITPNWMSIFRESERNLDVTGNTLLRLSMKETDPTKTACPAEGKDAEDAHVDILVTEVKNDTTSVADLDHPSKASITHLPLPHFVHCPLVAKVWMLYEERAIIKGRSQYSESSQDVTLVRDGEAVGPVVIVPADDVSPAVWRVRVVNKEAKGPETSKYLRAHVTNGTPRDVVFTSLEPASELSRLLRLISVNVAGDDKGAQVSGLTFDFDKDSSFVPVRSSETPNENCPLNDSKSGVAQLNGDPSSLVPQSK